MERRFITMNTDNTEYEIIDAHAHIFPQKIADKAVASIGNFYGIPMGNTGVSEVLLTCGKQINVSKYLVCSTATRPEQVLPINDFIYAEGQAHEEFIPFATLHPSMENIEAEVNRILSRGIKGVKLHPDFQEFNIDDEKAMEIYRLCEGRLAILFHTGDARYDFSAPARLATAAKRFPKLICIAAHFGGYRRWDEAYRVYEGINNIYMDTSSSLFTLDKETALKFIEKFGADHFFFGTDFPMWKHDEELARFMNLGLSKEDNRKIFADNFKRVIL